MPEDKLDQIFERFYSDRPASDSTRGKNSGLGLSISREIIAAHGGRIWAENRRATNGTGEHVVGASFTVRLPALGASSGRERATATLSRNV
jgi:two-component system sensor histidine kinase ChvG